jgi:3-methyladenine DNA glycosylase/8-oxoguanine DNA glycosylase
VKRVKKYFSTVEYLISDGELRLEVIVYHLNDNRNVITAGFRLEAIKELFKEWGRWGSYAQLYALNRDKVLSSALAQCIDNYRAMVSIELS